ncbi:MAG: N-acetylmuramoyl-L-alanine amidase [Negativicutes bacterium]|nr:N-acetylmuramoyl-L-alanine amidase [Negativicutes bacterium]
MKVCIDPDPGWSGRNEITGQASVEAEINMAIARIAGDMLLSAGYEVIYTRETENDTRDLMMRIDIANASDADIFLSLRCRRDGDCSARGSRVYCYLHSEEGFRLASCVQAELAALNYTSDQGVQEEDYDVLRLTNMPAVSIDCGNLSSGQDYAALTSPEWQEKIASGIVLGIQTYAVDWS